MVWQSRMGLFRRDAERYVAVWQSRTGSVRSNKARFGMAVRDGTGWNRCDMKRYGTKGFAVTRLVWQRKRWWNESNV